MREKLTTDDLKQELRESLETPIDLLNSQMKRLSLKEKPFQTFKPAEDGEIDDIWQQCLKIEQALQVRDALLLYSLSKVILTLGMLC